MKCALLIATVLATVTCRAQTLVDNGADITILAGAQVTVKGDVLSTAGATIASNGTIDLSGDFTNDSGNDLFGSSQGTVLLNGGAQSIGGSSVTLFNNLSLLGGPVTLTQDISTGGYPVPNGVLALGQAQLFLNSQMIAVLNPAPGAITRTTGFLISETGPLAGYGQLQWFIGASASGSYVFPFGNDLTNDYLPVTVNVTAPGIGSTGSITCSTYPTDPFATPNNRPLPTGLPSLTDVGGNENAPNVVDRYWPMHADDFSTPPTATIALSYRESEWSAGNNAIAEAQLQAQRFDGAAWSQPPMGVVNTAVNTVTTALTNDYDVVWALVQSSSPLPVELLAFNASPDGDEVLCTWATASELNNDFFTVERSADGTFFDDIGEVDGAGTSQAMHDYAFSDKHPLIGLSYYRLRQTDFDGTGRWSDVVAVRRSASIAEMLVYPNPCSDRLFIAGGVVAGEKVLVLDATGRAVMDSARLVSGSIDVSALPAGSYSMRMSTASGLRTARFVKQ